MIAGICFAEDYGLQLVIHWFPKSPECVCRFSSVLDPESLPKTVKVAPEDLYMATEVMSEDQWRQAYAKWDRTSDLTWKSYGIFYSNSNYDKHLRNLKPSPPVRDFLQRRCAEVNWATAIGVHIRRGDNKKSIEGSPFDEFVKRMREAPDTFFVIATDDQNVRDQLSLEFAERCLFPAVTLSRKTEDGMIHAVVDFFALAKCTELWGSYWSSFSEIAARYGKIDLKIVE